MDILKSMNYEDGLLMIKAFDVNSRKNNPTTLAEKNPADSYLISYEKDGDTVHILLDAGKPGHGEKVIIPYLIEKGIDKLDYLILSHFHLDHFGGMLDIAEDERISINRFVYSPISDSKLQDSLEDQFYKMWIQLKMLLNGKSTEIIEIDESRIGDRIHIHTDLFLDTISAPNEQMIAASETLNLNEFNFVWKLTFHNFTALFPGDCGEFQANDILNSPQKEMVQSVSLLKASHHGGDDSTTSEFIELCNPKVVLIPCNEIVVEKRPSFRQKLHEFSRNGAKIFRADRCNDLEVYTNGHELVGEMDSEVYSETVRLKL
jgi:competence protein ComEC